LIFEGWVQKRNQSVDQVLHFTRQRNVDGRGKNKDVCVSELGIKGLHAVLDVALAGLLTPARELSTTGLDVQTFSIEQLHRSSSFSHAIKERRQYLRSVSLLHFWAAIYGYYFSQDRVACSSERVAVLYNGWILVFLVSVLSGLAVCIVQS
jgi:hypothetical protein